MLGRVVRDPLGVESAARIAEGLGLLPADTVMAAEKTTEVRAATTRGGVRFTGYEIHLGMTHIEGTAEPFARLDDGRVDGACTNGVVGTYLHGALENADVCAELFDVPVQALTPKREQYQRLADWFERHGRGLSQLGLS